MKNYPVSNELKYITGLADRRSGAGASLRGAWRERIVIVSIGPFGQ